MNTLKQKKNFLSREIRISESKFFYKESKFANENEFDIAYESLDGEKISHKNSNSIILSISIIFYILSIATFFAQLKGADVEKYAWIFWAIVATIVLTFYWTSREDMWKIKLVNNGYIFIHKNIPSKEIVDSFIKDLLDYRNEYLKENYSFIDENLSYEAQLNNLKWLRSINVISKAEFEDKYSELKRLVKPSKKVIGFEK